MPADRPPPASPVRPSRWRRAGRILTVLLFLLVATLVASRLRALDWDAVGAGLRGYGLPTLALAALLSALSYATYSCYDLLGRRYTGHKVAPRRVMAIAFVSYAFNLNLGAWIGGIGFRYRLYSRHGLDNGRITRILGLSLATNWLGYLALAGLVFVLHSLPLPESFALGAGTLRAIGAVLLAVAVAYLALCLAPGRRVLRVRRIEIPLPQARMGLAQLALSLVNWLLIAAVLWVLLGRELPFATVLAVLLVSSIAAVVAHIPGGLGVLEAVFLAFLSGMKPESELMAALIVFRAIYYLAPLLIGSGLYLALEARARRHPPAPAAAVLAPEKRTAAPSGDGAAVR